MKHPNYEDNMLPPNNDIFKPEFRRDSQGRYFMQLPGYGKWQVSVTPGSKIISQGSQDEAGNAATNPESLMTGSLSASTVITVGNTIHLDGTRGCIRVTAGDYLKWIGPSMSLCGNGLYGYIDTRIVFGFFMEDTNQPWRTGENLDKGDFFVGSLVGDEYVLWNDSEGKLYIKGDLVIEGNLMSANYVYNTSGYLLEYLTGNAYFNDVFIHGGSIDESLITNLLPGSEPSIQGWSHDMDFTAADWDTIDWTSGNIYLTDGTTFPVDAGTMDMINDDPYYIYYNGSTTLSVTSDPTQAVGSGKILITVARRNLIDNTKKATFQVFGNEGQGVFIIADDIAANTITANEIFANTITTDEIAFGTIVGDNISSLNIYGKSLKADTGDIAGWEIDTYCLTKDQDIGASGEVRIQLCTGYMDGGGTYHPGHLQAAYNHNRITYPGFPHPNAPVDLIQMTQGDPTDPSGQPEPRIDIYRATPSDQSKKRMMLNAFGLHFYDENETLVGTITGADGSNQTNMDIETISIASDRVRIMSTGVIVRRGVAFNADDGIGLFFQMYVDTSWEEDYGGYQNVLSMSSSNYLKIEKDNGDFVARFSGVPGGSYALHLAGALRLGLVSGMSRPTGQHGVVYYDDGSYDATRRGNFYGYDGYTASWVTLSGSGLPSGGSYDMMRNDGGTSWVSTADVYWGGSANYGQVPDQQYHLYRKPSNPGAGDAILNIPNGRDFSVNVGGSYRFVIYSSGLVWTNGTIQAWNTFEFGAGGDIYSDGGKFYFSKYSQFQNSVFVSQNLIMNGSLTVHGTTFLPFTVSAPGSNLDGKKVLAN